MKAFVTGGTGFIGSHLVDTLIDSESFDEIRCLVRSKEKWLSGKDFVKISGDLNDIQALNKGLKDVDVLFHLAAIVKAPTWKEFQLANVDATENLIRIAKKNGVKNIIVLSSLAVSGPSDGKPVNEQSGFNPVSMYGRSKKEMEEMIHKIAGEEMSVKIIRPPAVFGPREDQIFTYFKTFSKGISSMVGDGNQPKLSMVYISDLINGIMKSLEKTDVGVHTYFITGKKSYSWNQIHHITAKVLGKSALKIKLNPTLVKKLGAFVENAASFFGKYPVLNKEKAKELVLEWTCSSEKAEKELGYIPEVSLEEGISRTLHWYKKHNWI